MPAPIQITLNTKTYNISILTVEMDNILQEMEANKNEVRRATERRKEAQDRITENCNSLLLMYIQQTGEFPH
jgi:hypothetical protein